MFAAVILSLRYGEAHREAGLMFFEEKAPSEGRAGLLMHGRAVARCCGAGEPSGVMHGLRGRPKQLRASDARCEATLALEQRACTAAFARWQAETVPGPRRC